VFHTNILDLTLCEDRYKIKFTTFTINYINGGYHEKRIVFLLCLIIALCLPIATVCAAQETASSTAYIGISATAVSGAGIVKTSASNTDYCVNLLGCSAPGIPTNYVVANNLVFRPYTTNGVEAANVVNFYNTYCDGNNRLYGSYIYSRGGNGSSFILKKTLNSSSVSSSIYFTLRWNP
jgi:hypothetical protein